MDIHFYLIWLINPLTLLKYILMQDYLKGISQVGTWIYLCLISEVNSGVMVHLHYYQLFRLNLTTPKTQHSSCGWNQATLFMFLKCRRQSSASFCSFWQLSLNGPGRKATKATVAHKNIVLSSWHLQKRSTQLLARHLQISKPKKNNQKNQQ